jgi:hypothetical protein
MPIYTVKIDSAALQQSGQPQAAAKGFLRDPSQDAGTAGLVPGDQVLLSGNLDRKFNEVQLKNEQHNTVAGAIRSTDRAAQALGQKIDALKAPLETIVKNFPPFSPQDKERMRLLMNYSSIRKEIDQLTFPTPPDLVRARKAMALPHPLPMNSNDSQIADHVAKLDATAASLNGMRAGLAADTASLLHDGRFYRIFSAPKGAETAQSGPVLTESAAAQKSAEVGRQFAEMVRQGVTVDHSQFLKGLS